MTMLNTSPRYVTAAPVIRRGFANLLARLGCLVNHRIAATVARHERQADLFILRHLSDRELRDIGLSRGDIGEGLAEAAKARLWKQQGERRERSRQAD